jgi:predicted DNA-binding protein
MNTIVQHEVPVSFPIRMAPTLHKEFTRISDSTQINKSVLARIAIEKMIRDVDESGVIPTIQRVCEV